MIRPLRVVALDLSLTATGIAVTHDQVGEPRLSCRTVTPRRRPTQTRIDHQRLHETIGSIMATVQCRPDLVVIEEPLLVDGKGDASIRVAELHGAIKHWLWCQGHPYVDVHPSKLKQYATGNGGAKKAQVREAVTSRYGRLLHIGTDDEADAVTLLAMAQHQYGEPLVVPPNHNIRALAGVKWPELDLTEAATS